MTAHPRTKKKGQTEEEVDGRDQGGLQRDGSQAVRCYPVDTKQSYVEDVRGRAADACQPGIAKALSPSKSKSKSSQSTGSQPVGDIVI